MCLITVAMLGNIVQAVGEAPSLVHAVEWEERVAPWAKGGKLGDGSSAQESIKVIDGVIASVKAGTGASVYPDAAEFSAANWNYIFLEEVLYVIKSFKGSLVRIYCEGGHCPQQNGRHEVFKKTFDDAYARLIAHYGEQYEAALKEAKKDAELYVRGLKLFRYAQLAFHGEATIFKHSHELQSPLDLRGGRNPGERPSWHPGVGSRHRHGLDDSRHQRVPPPQPQEF